MRKRRIIASPVLLLPSCAWGNKVVAFSEEATMISVETLREKYSYCPDTGEIRNRKLGIVIRKKSKNRRTSYIHLSVCGHAIYAHRAAWALHYGEWPKGQLDHRDGNGLNNRIDNLRDSTHAQNQRNQRIHIRNKTGVRGVCIDKKSGKWQALIWDGNGKRIHLGRFTTVEAAAAARKEAEAKYWL
jgi:hypothetical protein